MFRCHRDLPTDGWLVTVQTSSHRSAAQNVAIFRHAGHRNDFEARVTLNIHDPLDRGMQFRGGH